MSNSSQLYGKRATSRTIQLSARRDGLTMAEAQVLSVVLFWCQGQDGGVHRGGHRWTYRSAKDIAAETGQSPRAVERALRSLREKEVIETQAWRRPDRPGERACHFRPLELGDKLLAAAQVAERSRRSKRRSLDEADDMAASDMTDRRDGNRQSGGLKKQLASQRDMHPDEEVTSSSLRNDDEPAGESHVCQQVEERGSGHSPAVIKERQAAAAVAASFNSVLRDFGLPPVTCVTHIELDHLLRFKQALCAASAPLEPTVERVIRFWPIFKSLLPLSIQRHPANELRPNAIALGLAADRIAQVSLLFERLDTFAASSKNAKQFSYDGKSLCVVAALALLQAAKTFLCDKQELYDPEGWRRLGTLTRRAFERMDTTWLYDNDERSMEIVTTALSHADFLPWAERSAAKFLPNYRARKNAVSRSMAREIRLQNAIHAAPERKRELAAAAKAACEEVSSLPSEEQLHRACVDLWRQFASLVSAAEGAEAPEGDAVDAGASTDLAEATGSADCDHGLQCPEYGARKWG